MGELSSVASTVEIRSRSRCGGVDPPSGPKAIRLITEIGIRRRFETLSAETETLVSRSPNLSSAVVISGEMRVGRREGWMPSVLGPTVIGSPFPRSALPSASGPEGFAAPDLFRRTRRHSSKNAPQDHRQNIAVSRLCSRRSAATSSEYPIEIFLLRDFRAQPPLLRVTFSGASPRARDWGTIRLRRLQVSRG